MIAFALAILLMCLFGCLAVRHLIGGDRQTITASIIACLGTGIGIAVGSVIYFLAVAVAPQGANGYWWVVQLGLTLALIVPLIRTRAIKASAAPPTVAIANVGQQSLDYVRIGSVCFLVLASLAAASFWSQFFNHPHSDWDALMIWNVRARFLERLPIDLHQVFSPLMGWSHVDYPLLVPAICGFGLSLSNENQLAPATIAFIFTAATIWLLFASQTMLRSKIYGLCAAFLLLMTPFWLDCGAMMYADVPLAFYILATVVCFSLHDRVGGKRLLVLAGAFAGMAAWSKNEGLLFLLCISAAEALATKDVRASIIKARWFVVGLLPMILLIVWFKVTLAPPNDLVAGQGFVVTIHRLLDPSRIAFIALFFTTAIFTFGGWIVSPIPMLAAVWFMSKSSLQSISARRAALVVSFMLLGYAAVFWVTPSSLQQHLSTAVDRLFLQLWPLAIFTLIDGLQPIEELMTTKATAAPGHESCGHLLT